MSEFDDAQEWWQIDRERRRCSEILALCIQARRPALALVWIADGSSVEDVTGRLFAMVCAEQRGQAQPIEIEFDARPEVFCGHGISRARYLSVRSTDRPFEPVEKT